MIVSMIRQPFKKYHAAETPTRYFKNHAETFNPYIKGQKTSWEIAQEKKRAAAQAAQRRKSEQ